MQHKRARVGLCLEWRLFFHSNKEENYICGPGSRSVAGVVVRTWSSLSVRREALGVGGERRCEIATQRGEQRRKTQCELQAT